MINIDVELNKIIELAQCQNGDPNIELAQVIAYNLKQYVKDLEAQISSLKNQIKNNKEGA